MNGLAEDLCNEGARQFNEGYQEEKRRIEASEDYEDNPCKKRLNAEVR